MEVKIVGLYYRGEAARLVVEDLEPGDLLQLEAEPDNQYDQYAVKALFEGLHIGYLPKDISSFYEPQVGEEHPLIRVDKEQHRLYPVIDIS